MTNSEKYLNVSVNEFFKAIMESEIDISGLYSLEKWLFDEAKPTLTEDERVILKNINKNFTHIYRLNNRLQVADGEENCNNTILDITAFGHLFQFIKERRRIFNRRIIRR